MMHITWTKFSLSPESSKKRAGDEKSLPAATKKSKQSETPLFQLPTQWSTGQSAFSASITTLKSENKEKPNSASSSSSPSEPSTKSQPPRNGVFGFKPRDPSLPAPIRKTPKYTSPPVTAPVEPVPPPSILSKPTVEQTLPTRYVAEGMSVDKALSKIIPTSSNSSASDPMIIIDSANVSCEHGQGVFSTQGLPLAVKYYKSIGFNKIVAFLPDHYLTQHFPDPLQDWTQLEALVEQKILVPTPAADYDDLYIVQFARKNNGVIVTNDKYRDVPLAFKDPEERTIVSNWIKLNRIPFKFSGDQFEERIAAKRHPLKDTVQLQKRAKN